MSDPDHLQMWEDHVADMDKDAPTPTRHLCLLCNQEFMSTGPSIGMREACPRCFPAPTPGENAELIARLRKWPATGEHDPFSSITVGGLMGEAAAALVAAEGEKRRLMLNHNDMVRRKRDAEAIKDARAEAALAEVKRLREALECVKAAVEDREDNVWMLDGETTARNFIAAALAPTQEKPECR